jgi:phosphatidate cytidylyltransferase
MPIALIVWLPVLGLAVLTVWIAASALSRGRLRIPSTLRGLWGLGLVLGAASWFSFAAGIWLLALLAFASLREYFSLLDIRLQDRAALLAAYLFIPLMAWLIQIDWYGLFIVSIPVYAFLLIPFLVVVGGHEARGSVLSIGAIDFGLFFFVYCLGHIGYLARVSVAAALALVLSVAACDLVDRALGGTRRGARGALLRLLLSAPPSLVLWLLVAALAGLPARSATGLGLLTPLLVLMGNITTGALEEDLGIDPARLEPGRGRLIDAARSYLFVGPVVFHILRYFTDVL